VGDWVVSLVPALVVLDPGLQVVLRFNSLVVTLLDLVVDLWVEGVEAVVLDWEFLAKLDQITLSLFGSTLF
jgi:hypothetical protein